MDSIIFDLDGTLWDSRATVLKAWNLVIKKHEIEKELSQDDFRKTMGLQVKEIGQIFFPELTEQKREHLLTSCCDLENEYIKEQGGLLYEHVERVLKELSSKYKLYIVSNCQEGYIEAFFAYHQLGKYFLDFENPGRTGLSKGENIKLVIDRNKLTDPIYVGDTEGDRSAAAFARIPFVYGRYGFGAVSQSDFAINRFEDLLNLFA